MLYLIHQGGKVASQTLEGTIAASHPGAAIERHHYLRPENLDALDRICDRAGENPHAAQQRHQTTVARRALEVLAQEDPRSVWVISGFRDPLDHVVSRFFQNLSEFCPSHSSPQPDEAYDADRFDVEVDRVITLFNQQVEDFLSKRWEGMDMASALEKFWSVRYAVHMDAWFEFEFKPVHNLDIYDIEFGSKSFVTLASDRGNFVFYRMEGFRESLPALLAALPLPKPAQILNRNVGAEKEYAVLYRRFRERFVPSQSMLAYYYESRFFRHLYAGAAPIYGDTQALKTATTASTSASSMRG